jgi:hypothetical protein
MICPIFGLNLTSAYSLEVAITILSCSISSIMEKKQFIKYLTSEQNVKFLSKQPWAKNQF